MNTYFSKILVIFLFSIGVSSTVFPQTVKVTGFRMDEMDLSAQMPVVFDINKNPCGLLKVGLPLKGVTFEGSGVFSYEYNNGEYWVYMLEGSEYITIKTPKFHPFDYDFSENIQGKQTYVMTVALPDMKSSALLRSAFVPGWGQFYKGRNARGTLIVIGETLTLAAGGLSLYNELNQKSIMDKPEVSYQDYIAAEKSYEQWNTARHISFITAAVIYSLNLVDAYLTPAKSQNNIVFTPNVMNANGEMAVGATMSIRF